MQKKLFFFHTFALVTAMAILLAVNSGVVLVGRQMGDYLLVAMPHFGQPDGPGGFAGRRPQAEVMLISVFVSGLAAIGVIWLFSVVFARYQLRQIMRPVNALTAGAKRVEQGDLSTPVAYQGRDEFTSVCAAFDQMQRHLLEEREKNAAYERARTDLVAGISHDLRTPLTSVKGYIKGMRDGVANTPEKQERYLDIAYRKSCDMERLLYFSRLETGNLPMFPVEAHGGAVTAQNDGGLVFTISLPLRAESEEKEDNGHEQDIDR